MAVKPETNILGVFSLRTERKGKIEKTGTLVLQFQEFVLAVRALS